MMKRLNWKIVMFVAVIFMITGFAVSVCGLGMDKDWMVITGIVTMMAVCVSWWFWVMFVIKTMISCTERTLNGIGNLRGDLQQLRQLLIDFDLLSKDK